MKSVGQSGRTSMGELRDALREDTPAALARARRLGELARVANQINESKQSSFGPTPRTRQRRRAIENARASTASLLNERADEQPFQIAKRAKRMDV